MSGGGFRPSAIFKIEPFSGLKPLIIVTKSFVLDAADVLAKNF